MRRDEFGAVVRNIATLRGWLGERDRLEADNRNALEQEEFQQKTRRAAVVLDEASALVGRAERGDYSMRISAASDDPSLARIVAGLNAINQGVDRATAEMGSVLSGLAAGNLTVRVLGDYDGRLGDIKTAVNEMAGRLAGIISGIGRRPSTSTAPRARSQQVARGTSPI